MVSNDTNEGIVVGDRARVGQVVSLNSAIPAAGTDPIFTVPAGQLLRVFTVKYVLNTSAVFNNRTPTLRLRDNTNSIISDFGGIGTTPASSTGFYNYISGFGFATGNTSALPIELWLPAGWSLSPLTSSLDAADQFTAITIYGIRYQ